MKFSAAFRRGCRGCIAEESLFAVRFSHDLFLSFPLLLVSFLIEMIGAGVRSMQSIPQSLLRRVISIHGLL